MLSLKIKPIKVFSAILQSRVFKIIAVISLLILIVSVSLVGFYYLYYWGKILPNIKLAGVPVGGIIPEKAIIVLEKNISPPEFLVLSDGTQEFKIRTFDIGLKYDYTKTVSGAYELYRTGNLIYDLLGGINLHFREVNLGLRFEIDPEKLQEALSVIAGQVAQEPINPSITIVDNQIIIEEGSKGKDVDLQKLSLNIGQVLAFARSTTLKIPTTVIDTTWSDKDLGLIKLRAEKLIGKSLNITFEEKSFGYSDTDLVSFLEKNNGFNTPKVTQIIEKVENQINRDPENSVFVFREGKVEEFKASKDGIKVIRQDLENLIEEKIKFLEQNDQKSITATLPVSKFSPEVTTSEVNNLGIKELIGRGGSKFAGSISSRIHNIGLASSKFNGVLVEPSKEVSFNDILGDVSSYTGYKQAYVIRDGKTVLGDGGGVCQVSTTLFRAVLNAGLPVIERRSHSYRVGYYEQGSPPGLDATVFAPTTDFKFKNDTPGYILIQTLFDPKKYELVFEIYGTNDGRVASITKPVVSGVTPPPEDLYTDDPTLPTGVIKQIDYKAWGAKVTFNYKVERNNEVVFEKTFISSYRPWQAKFLKGTGTN